MIEVVDVTLDCNDKRYKFKINRLKPKCDDLVIVKTSNGLQVGKVVSNVKLVDKKKNYNLNSITRIASIKDEKVYKKNKIDAQKAFIKCRELVKKLKLDMNLIDSMFTFDRSQLIFRFTSDERVDFRNLAKELANIYKTRIELRQIGVRDKAKEIGGCGQCGRTLCCYKFLKDFNSVSINMAKNQNIALNPNKINGICGRLLCCLKYEDDCYKESKKHLPNLGKTVKTKEGTGKVVNIDILQKKYWVEIKDKGIIECKIDDSSK